MPYPYNTLEYKHLMLAQRALAHEIEHPGEDTNLATLAAGLVKVIDQKRIMRGQGAPKPVDGKARRTARAPSLRPALASVVAMPVASPVVSNESAPPTTPAA